MRALIARHPIIFCTAAFAAVMGMFSIVWKWFVYAHSASWIEVGAVFVGMLVIGVLIERRDRQRDVAD